MGLRGEQAAGVLRDAAIGPIATRWPKPDLLCAGWGKPRLSWIRGPGEPYPVRPVLTALRLVAAVSHWPIGRRPCGLAWCSSDGCGSTADPRRRWSRRGGQAEGTDGADADLDSRVFARTAWELNRTIQGDPGVLAALLMNRITLTRMMRCSCRPEICTPTCSEAGWRSWPTPTT